MTIFQEGAVNINTKGEKRRALKIRVQVYKSKFLPPKFFHFCSHCNFFYDYKQMYLLYGGTNAKRLFDDSSPFFIS